MRLRGKIPVLYGGRNQWSNIVSWHLDIVQRAKENAGLTLYIYADKRSETARLLWTLAVLIPSFDHLRSLSYSASFCLFCLFAPFRGLLAQFADPSSDSGNKEKIETWERKVALPTRFIQYQRTQMRFGSPAPAKVQPSTVQLNSVKLSTVYPSLVQPSTVHVYLPLLSKE